MANRGRGYVKAWRCIDEHPIWNQCSEAVLKVFMVCLFKAEREPVSWFDGLRQVELPNGSFLTCLADMIEYSHLTTKQVRGSLSRLVDLQIIEKRARSGAGSRMAITVLNWETWQGSRDGPGQIIGQDRGRIGAGSGQVFETLPPGCKEVFVSSFPPPNKTRTRRGEGENKPAHATLHAGNGNGSRPTWDPGPGWLQVEALCRQAPVAPAIRRPQLALQAYLSACETAEILAAILAGITAYKASSDVANGAVMSLENFLRDRAWGGTFARPPESETERERRRVMAL
jgi:hypothetical protein